MQLLVRTLQLKKKENNNFFAPENMKKPPSKVAHNRPRPLFSAAQIQPKSQFLFHKNLPLRGISLIMNLVWSKVLCAISP